MNVVEYKERGKFLLFVLKDVEVFKATSCDDI